MFTFTSRPGPAAWLDRLGGLRRLRARHARLIAATLAGLGVWLVVSPLVSRLAAGHTPAVTLTHDVPAGQTLTAADLSITRFPAGLVPHSALTETVAAVGKRLSTSATQGEVLTSARLAPTRGLRGNEVAMTISVEAATAATLRAGDVCDLLLQSRESGSPTSTGRTAVRILEMFSNSRSGNIGLNDQGHTTALIAIRSQDANKINLLGEGAVQKLLIKPYP